MMTAESVGDLARGAGIGTGGSLGGVTTVEGGGRTELQSR
jgi:hypothetical protein